MRDTTGNRLRISDIKAQAHDARHPDGMERLLALVHDADPVVSRNAAWVMTHFDAVQIAQLQPRQDELIDLILSTTNTSLRRLLLNVVERQQMTADSLRTDFLDFCLAHTADPQEQPGIQSLCMKLAYRQCRFFPELMHEFRAVLSLMDSSYAKSVLSLRRKYARLAE